VSDSAGFYAITTVRRRDRTLQDSIANSEFTVPMACWRLRHRKPDIAISGASAVSDLPASDLDHTESTPGPNKFFLSSIF
jgi:hypothetical protein